MASIPSSPPNLDMAKLKALPSQAIIDGFSGKIDFYLYHPTCDPENRGQGIPVARKWPRSPGHQRAAAVEAQWATFSAAAQAWALLSQEEQDSYRHMASGSGLTGRDLFTRNYIKGILTSQLKGLGTMPLYLLNTEVSIVSTGGIAASIPWTDIDLSALVPPAATHAYIRESLNHFGNVAAQWINCNLREKGSTQWVGNLFHQCAIASNWSAQNDLFAKLDPSKKLEYKVDIGPGLTNVVCEMWLLGWII